MFISSQTESTNFYPLCNSIDKTINKQDRILVEEMQNLGMILLNGSSISDVEGCFTYVTNNGSSVMNLVWTNHTHA